MAQSQKISGQRGRTLPKQQRSRTPLLLIVGILVVLVIGVVIVGLQSQPKGSAITFRPRPIAVPTGLTPEGFAYMGQPNAPVTVIEYGDFECPSCGAFANQAEAALEQQYINTGKVRLIYHDFPLPQHEHAILAASAARAAGEQGAFWQMHELLFTRQREWANATNPRQLMSNYAVTLGLDQKAFDQVIDSGKYTQILQDAAIQSAQRGINSTPTFDVNGKLVDASKLNEAITAALANR